MDGKKGQKVKQQHIYIYRKGKLEVKEGNYYNDEESRIIFKMRSNSLKLNDRNRFTEGDTRCELCDTEREDLEHFLLDCRE